MSQIPPIPYSNLPSYPIATISGRTTISPPVVYNNAQLLPLLQTLPLKLPDRGGVNQTYSTSGPVSGKVFITGIAGIDDAKYGPWVPSVTGATGATYLPPSANTFNLTTKTYKVQNNNGSTGGNLVPNYNNGLITPLGTTGSTGTLINIVPYAQINVNTNTIDFETNDVPLDSVYGRFPLYNSLIGPGTTGIAYTFPSQTGWTGTGYLPGSPYTGPTNQKSNVYDTNPNFYTIQNIRYSIPRYPTFSSNPGPVDFSIIGFSFKNTPFFTCLSQTALDAISIEALDANYQHVEQNGILHTHSPFAFINDGYGNWTVSTDVKVIGFMYDGVMTTYYDG